MPGPVSLGAQWWAYSILSTLGLQLRFCPLGLQGDVEACSGSSSSMILVQAFSNRAVPNPEMRRMDMASYSSALRFGAVSSGRWGQNPRGRMMMELVMLYSARIFSGWPWLTVFCGDQRKLVSWSPIQWIGIPSPVVGSECLSWLFPGRAGTLGKHCSLSSPEKVCFLAGLTHPLGTDGTVHGPTTLVVVQSLSRVQLFATPWTAAHQASLSFTISQSLLRLMSIESAIPSNHLIFCHPLHLLPSIFPSIRVFSSELTLHIKCPKYWSFSISPSNKYSALYSFRIDWFDLLALPGTYKHFFKMNF